MEQIISDWVGSELIDSITHTIIQSVWLGAIIGVITWLIFRSVSSDNPVKKYRIALLGIASLFVTSAITFVMSYVSGIAMDTSEVAGAITTWTAEIIVLDSESLALTQSWIGYLWILGVIGFTIKFLFDLSIVQFIRYTSYTNEDAVQHQLLLNKIASTEHVKLKVSDMIQAPVTIGFVKPMILFPVSMLTQLTGDEIESILRHEIAHVIRKDYLINILQTLMEIVLFYHPLVWWLSRVAREQREYCCDDVAMDQKSAIDYAKTLVRIQELALAQRQTLVMSFADQSMLNRIKRIMKLPKSNRNMKEKLIATAAIVFMLAFFSKDMIANVTEKMWPKLAIENTDIPRESVELAMEVMPIDTLPNISKHSYSMTKSGDEGSISIKKENGKITKLEIDGRRIPESEYDRYQKQIDEMDGNTKPRTNVWMFSDGQEINDEELEEKFEQLGIEMEEWGENFGEQFGEDFGKSMEEWGENFGETFGKEMEEFGRSMEIWGEEFENGVQWKIENGDTVGMYSFDIPELDEDMMNQLQDVLGSIDLEGLKIMELEGITDELSEMLKGLELDDLQLNEDGLQRRNKGFGSSRTVEDKIGYELRKDRLIAAGEVSEIELTGKHMKVNGDKQPKNIWNKYKEIFEEESGIALTKDSKLKFNVEGKRTMKKSSAF